MARAVAVLSFTLALTGCIDLMQKLAKRGTADAGVDAAIGANTTTPPSAPAELEKAFAALDINRDDQLDGTEVKSCGCAIADANGDGEITKAEYLAAGLVGKLRPGAAPGPVTPAAPAPAPAPAPPAPAPRPTASAVVPAPPEAGGVPPGLYTCSGTVGTTFMTTGRVLIIDATHYATGADRSGQGTYEFFPDTSQIVFTSGPNADLDTISFARLVSPNRIQMKTGKNGRSLWDCKR